MTLKLRIKSLEDVPAAHRSLYRPTEGGYALDCEVDAEAAAIRAKYDKLQADHARAQERLQGFAKADGSLPTADELRALQAAAAKASEADPAALDAKLAAMVGAAKKPLEDELTGHRAKLDGYRTRLLEAEAAAVVQRALDAMRPQDRWRPFLTGELRRRLRVTEGADGAFVHEVVGDDGKPVAGAKLDDLARGPLRRQFGDLCHGDGKVGADIINPIERRGGGGRAVGNGRDVVIPTTASQDQFEAAFKAACARGGNVVYADE